MDEFGSLGMEDFRRERADRDAAIRRAAELEGALARAREELRLTRLKLEETESALWQLAVVFGSAPLPVVLMDVRGRVTDVNARAERVLEARRNDLLGRSLKAVIPEDRHAAFDELVQKCAAGEQVRHAEHELWGNGSLRAMSTTMFPIRDPDGEVVGMALAEDVQELKDAGALLSTVNKELQQLATIDALTELPNRRSFEKALDREAARAARDGVALSIAMIDVDEFKRFNDQQGHAEGDDCLRRVAAALDAEVKRSQDFLGRYGGEEFVALLPATDREGAAVIAERMRAAVAAAEIPHPASKVAPFVTVSIGVATQVVKPGQDFSKLHEDADLALLRAKSSGRNRVEVAAVD